MQFFEEYKISIFPGCIIIIIILFALPKIRYNYYSDCDASMLILVFLTVSGLLHKTTVCPP